MKPISLFLMLLLPAVSVTVPAFAQGNLSKKNKIFITGGVYDSETREPLTNARFTIHKSENYATFSNGKFSLFGNPGDTISYRYLGYKEMRVVIPDTLKQLEYLLGVFMPKDTFLIPEVVIFPRVDSYPSIISRVQVSDRMINQARQNVNKAAVEGLTRPVKEFDAAMNTKKTLRELEMNAQNKGLLVTPENSAGLSTNGYRTHYLQFGSPILRKKKVTNAPANQHEIDLIMATRSVTGTDSVPISSKRKGK